MSTEVFPSKLDIHLCDSQEKGDDAIRLMMCRPRALQTDWLMALAVMVINEVTEFEMIANHLWILKRRAVVSATHFPVALCHLAGSFVDIKDIT